jgi:hypothetical protein
MQEAQVEIVDLTDEYEDSYLVCLEDWSDEMAEAGDHKARWHRTMRDRGLRVKLALGDDGRPNVTPGSSGRSQAGRSGAW